MIKNAKQIIQELQARKFAPVYFLHGEESYYIDLVSNFIEKNALDESQKGFNQTILYGRDINMATLLNQARRFPMMAERQVLIIKELAQMSDWNTAQANTLLEKYLEHPQPSTVLVLNHKHKALPKNAKIYKSLDKNAVVLESKKLYENQVPDWIQEYIKEKGHQIEEKAKLLLVESIGADLSRLSTELDKLLLNVRSNQKINEELVEEFVGISKDYNVFELQKALLQKDLYKSQQIIRYWAANPKKQALIPTLVMLFNFFSRVLLAYHQTDRSDQHLAKVLGVSPYFVQDYKTAMRSYSLNQLIKIIALIRKADLQAKGIEGGGMQESDILTELTTGIIFQ